MENYYTDCQGQPWVDAGGIYTEQSHACGICKEPTHRIDIDFQIPLHGICANQMWKEFWEANEKAGPITDW